MSKKRKLGVVKNDESPENAGGEKFEFPGDPEQSDLRDRLAVHRHSMMMDTLRDTEQHISRLKKSFSEAIWDQDAGEARVTSQKGKHWVVMGHFRDGSTWLHPEEALWLLYNGNLKLVTPVEGQEEPLEITCQWFLRRVFSEAPSSLTMQHYSLYQYLRHIGCVCRRSTLSIAKSLIMHRNVPGTEEGAPVPAAGPYSPLVANVSASIHRDIYQTLQIIPRMVPSAPAELEGENQYLIFDVWRAEGVKKFKRSSPPLPVWRVVTIQLSAGVKVPSSNQLSAVYSKLSAGGVQVMIALVDVRGDKPVFMSLGPETIVQNDPFALKNK